MAPRARTAVVIATRNRPGELAATVERLRGLPERPAVVVVDNASDRGSRPPALEDPGVEVVHLARNLGGAARTVGARRVSTPYVAFADDDSWWAPGALDAAAARLDASERLALVAARVLVGAEERDDPVCEAMRSSPLPPEADLPGPPVLGFVACGAVVRRSAFLEVGGFHPAFGIGGEEELLALDLTAGGWGLAYVEHVVAHHHPSPSRDPSARRRGQLRNALWTAWLRRPFGAAVRATLRLVAHGPGASETAGALADAVRGVSLVARERRVVPREVERRLRALERG